MPQVVKNPPADAGDARDKGSIPRSERSPGVGSENPLQYSCLKKSHGQRSLVGCTLDVSVKLLSLESTQGKACLLHVGCHGYLDSDYRAGIIYPPPASGLLSVLLPGSSGSLEFPSGPSF